MIYKDPNWGSGAGEEMLPTSEAIDKTHEFLVLDVIVPFSIGKCT